jgi:hypothetical protein
MFNVWNYGVTPHSTEYTPYVCSLMPSGHHSLDIDFDEAHDAWMVNKRKLANGMYRYICIGKTKTGKKCGRTPEKNSDTCITHREKPQPIDKCPSLISQIYTFIRPKIFLTHETKYVKPILDVWDETILIRCTPPIYGSFQQLHEMINYYKNIADISNDYIPYLVSCQAIDITHLMLCLQLILSFLDGMDELTKLETKRSNITLLKMHILEFNGYDTLEYMHTTSMKWKFASDVIKTNTINIMMSIFECMEM